MFENFLSPATIRDRPQYAVYGGVLVTLVAFATSSLLFTNTPNFISVATVLFSVVLGVPAVNAFFRDEAEKVERKEGGFFLRHRGVLRFLFYFFMGSFIALFVLALVMPSRVLSSADLYGVESTAPIRPRGPPPPPTPEGNLVLGILGNNALVMGIAFILSLFYGSGALLLITLNASIFASAFADVVRVKAVGAGFVANFLFIGCNLVTLLLHLLPEMASYLLAATAGGILGNGVAKKVWRTALWPLVNDVLMLAAGSFLLLIISAVIEVKGSRHLFALNVCGTKPLLLVLIAAALVLVLIGIETFRRWRRQD